MNTGSVSIEKKDIDTPLSISFERPAVVLSGSVSVIKKVPGDLEIGVLNTPDHLDSITLPPSLLNPKDEFVIAALVSDFNDRLELRGRIVGVRSITRLKSEGTLIRELARARWTGAVATVVALLAGIVFQLSLIKLAESSSHLLRQLLK
jgi:hypothetical protein